MPIRTGSGEKVSVNGVIEVRLGDGTVLWGSGPTITNYSATWEETGTYFSVRIVDAYDSSPTITNYTVEGESVDAPDISNYTAYASHEAPEISNYTASV